MRTNYFTIKKIIFFLALLSIVLFATYYFLSPDRKTPNKHKIKVGIDSILTKFPEPITIGIQVESLATHQILYQKNSDHTFMPASNLKLFTATAALLFLGPDYRYQTTLLTNANAIENGVINGNVYLKFSADPDLQSDHLDQMLAELHTQGIQKISGNLYLDTTYLDDKKYAPAWMLDDLNYCYAAPIYALVLDHDCVKYTLTPAAEPEKPAKLTLESNQPQNAISITSNHVVLQKQDGACSLDLQVNDQNAATITGCATLKGDPPYHVDLPIVIKNPTLYTQQVLLKLLQKNGIQLDGKILEGKTSGNNILSTHYSRPLQFIVYDMLKNSDNLISNSLLKTMGANYYKQPGSWENGVQAMRAILVQQAKLNFDHSIIVDGDGQSRYNLVTPAQLSELLKFSYDSFSISPEFLSALPIGDHLGSLQKRFQEKNILVRAKTGSMTSIKSLSGYVEDTQKRILSFVILINNYTTDDETLNKLEDEIVEFLAGQ